LSEGSSLEKTSLQDQEIEAFISGATKETVFSFTTDTGKKLRVTGNHPLVLDNGLVVEASTVKTGFALLGIVEGTESLVKSEKIVSVQEEVYEGTVHNLQPVSTKRIENIVVAQGLLNGSNRFQNEWSQREYRIRARASHDVSDL
jgi:hypothetical protein